MPVRLVQSRDDRQNRFPLTAQKVPQHLVVGFAFLVSNHTQSPGERASSRQAARPT
jgi:hypothetical protein